MRLIDYRFPLNPDWKRIIEDLLNFGSYQNIADEIDLSDVAVLKLHKGHTKEPKYSNSVKIMLLYLDVIKKVIPERT